MANTNRFNLFSKECLSRLEELFPGDGRVKTVEIIRNDPETFSFEEIKGVLRAKYPNDYLRKLDSCIGTDYTAEKLEWILNFYISPRRVSSDERSIMIYK